ncbi:MAG: acyltransferase domain-containing protein [Pseudomonadales bacterium]|nr:acyltransferase domain-containing protein [Pseudomonadales bacterium]
MNTSVTNDRILSALKDARLKLEKMEHLQNEPIAIVGMAGRFPGAESVDALWELLKANKSGVRMLSDDELQASGIESSVYNQPEYVRAWASFDKPEAFAAEFFGYSPKEAELLDPQHRVFLESAWHALEHAGYDPQRYSGDIGVFAGSALNSYVINLHNNPKLRETTDQVQAVVSNVAGLMPTRVSYHLNLTGPSCGVQTGCSTSLVAVHQACQSLRANECQMALAGGVTVSDAIPHGYFYQEGSIASPDGVTRAFDAEGKGTVFGNGVAIVVLKRLSLAQKDGDQILAVIKGSAVNNDGSDKVGLIAPSVNGQAKAISTAIKAANIDPATLSMIEAHGTGTDLGDPIEVAALQKVLNPAFVKSESDSTNTTQCLIGSVKTNLGHLDAAAGATGLIKAVLSMQHQQIPASLNFQQANSNINFTNSPLKVNTELTPWPGSLDSSAQESYIPRRAGVSSFGMGGTNAHLILEEAPAIRTTDLTPRRWQILPISAATDTALDALSESISEHISGNNCDQQALAAAAFTLQIGRRELGKRKCFVTDSSNLLPVSGANNLGKESVTGEPLVVFVFSGQGSQQIEMAKGLYQTEPSFRENLDACADILRQLDNPIDLYQLLFPESDQALAKKHIQQTVNAQPVLFAVEYALAKLWQTWGVEPSVLLGHSVGEYVAACLAEVFDLTQALTLVAKRGELMQQCEPGSMLVVAMQEQALLSWLQQHDVDKHCDLAAVNGQQQTVLSGSNAAIEMLLSKLEEQGVAAKLLRTSHGFHSATMEPILGAFADTFDSMKLSAPTIDIISNLTGKLLTVEQATSPEYWVKQLRQTVRFADGIETVLTTISNPYFLEIGAANTLLKTIRMDHPLAKGSASLSGDSYSSGGAGSDDEKDIAVAISELWLSGVSFDWPAYQVGRPKQRIALPLYPFERKSYWVSLQENTITQQSTQLSDFESDDKQTIDNWFYVPDWETIKPLTSVASASHACHWVLVGPDNGQTNIVSKIKASLESDQKQTVTSLTMKEDFCPDRLAAVLQSKQDKASDIQFVYVVEQEHSTQHSAVDSIAESINERAKRKTLDIARFVQAVKGLQSMSDIADTITFSDIKLSIVTQGAYSISTTEKVDPSQIALNGFLQVAQQELGLAVRHIDLEATSNGFPTRNKRALIQLLQQQIEEPRSADTPQFLPCLALVRAGRIWQRSYQPQPLSVNEASIHCEIEEQACQEVPLVKNGTYVIAGDLANGLGMVFAHGLFEGYQAKIILCPLQQDSDVLPAPSQWEHWLATHGPKHPVSIMVRSLQILRQEGCEFTWCPGHLTNAEWWHGLIGGGEVCNSIKPGAISGIFVVDAMGDESSCVIDQVDVEEINRIYGQRLATVEALAQGLQQCKVQAKPQPEFVAIQSSLSTVVGGQSFATYSAVNAVLDGFVNERANQQIEDGSDVRWLTINWDAVDNDVIAAKQGAIASSTNDAVQTGLELTDHALSVNEGWQAMARVINASVTSQIVVSPRNLMARLKSAFSPTMLDKSCKDSQGGRPNLETPYAGPTTDTEKMVVEAMGELLGITRVGINDDFFDLGGHSLLAIQAVTRLRKEFQVELPMRTLLFEARTPAGIAKVIDASRSKLVGTNLEADAKPELEPVTAADAEAAIEAMLIEVESLSPEEAEQRLETSEKS